MELVEPDDLERIHPGKAVAASGGDNLVTDGVADEVSYGMHVKCVHDM